MSTDECQSEVQPDNVLVGQDGRPRVVDFGLAQVGLLDSVPQVEGPGIADGAPKPGQVVLGGRFTLSGVVAGTPGYMSPEQLRGGQIDPRSDQWSFCSALFEALYGYLPFEGKTLPELTETVYGPPRRPPPQTSVPEDLYRVLVRGLSVEPAARFPGMVELLEALFLEQGDDVASGQLTRQWLTRSVVSVALLLFTAVQIRQWERPLAHREGLAISVVMLLVLLIGGIRQRRILREQLFHRSVFVLLVVAISQNFFQRVIAAVSGTPLWKTVPFEMIVLGGNATLGMFLFFRRNVWLGLIPLIYGFIAQVSNLPSRLGSLVYIGTLLIFFDAWRKAARNSSIRRDRRDSGTISAMFGVRSSTSGQLSGSSRGSLGRTTSARGQASPDAGQSKPSNP